MLAIIMETKNWLVKFASDSNNMITGVHLCWNAMRRQVGNNQSYMNNICPRRAHTARQIGF